MANVRRKLSRIFAFIMIVLLLCAMISSTVFAEDFIVYADKANILVTDMVNTNSNNRNINNPYGFVLPLDRMNLIDDDDGGHISSWFGSRDNPFTGEPGDDHTGIDIAWGGIYGTPIKTVLNGVANVSTND